MWYEGSFDWRLVFFARFLELGLKDDRAGKSKILWDKSSGPIETGWRFRFELRRSGSSLDKGLPGYRALGDRRVISLIGIAPIPNRGRGRPGVGVVTVAIVIATVIGSRC